MQQLWNVNPKECYAVYRSVNKFSFYLTGAECTLYCDHKLLAPFLMTGMKSKTVDRWALELQQYNIKFQHVAGKDIVVADAISDLKTASLYKKRLYSINIPVNLDSLIAEQKSDSAKTK